MSLRGFVALSVLIGCAAASQVSLHLDSPADRDAFRRWFTFLTEAEFYAPKAASEVTDCAALVRWSFREALTSHDSRWADGLGLQVLPAIPPVRQFAWPHTPVGPDLFRISGTAEGQFADATTLRRYNTYFVSRDLAQALPGDLLFYRQFERAMPAHVMIYIGPSQFDRTNRRYLVYHTGPSAKSRGEIRKVAIEDLLAHPSPQWRPAVGNANFLGVWRLNILRDHQ